MTMLRRLRNRTARRGATTRTTPIRMVAVPVCGSGIRPLADQRRLAERR